MTSLIVTSIAFSIKATSALSYRTRAGTEAFPIRQKLRTRRLVLVTAPWSFKYSLEQERRSRLGKFSFESYEWQQSREAANSGRQSRFGQTGFGQA